MPDFKLANVLLHVDDHLSSFPEVLYRADGTTFRSSEDGSLGFGGSLDFLTYFNGISCSKWRQYADVSDIRLHLELAGDPCTIGFSGVGEHDVSAADAPSPALNNGESAVKAPVERESLGRRRCFRRISSSSPSTWSFRQRACCLGASRWQAAAQRRLKTRTGTPLFPQNAFATSGSQFATTFRKKSTSYRIYNK